MAINLNENEETKVRFFFFVLIIELHESLNTDDIKTKIKNRYKIIKLPHYQMLIIKFTKEHYGFRECF